MNHDPASSFCSFFTSFFTTSRVVLPICWVIRTFENSDFQGTPPRFVFVPQSLVIAKSVVNWTSDFMCPPADHAPGLYNVRNADAFAADPTAAGWRRAPVSQLQLQNLSGCTFQPSADGKTPTDAAAAQWLCSAAGVAIPTALDWLSEVVHVEIMIAIVDTWILVFVIYCLERGALQ